MYHSDTQTTAYERIGNASDLPAMPSGLQALLFGPGWLVLKLMDVLLQVPGSEGSWRDEVRRQCGSSFYGRIYGVIFWIMCVMMVGVLLVA